MWSFLIAGDLQLWTSAAGSGTCGRERCWDFLRIDLGLRLGVGTTADAVHMGHVHVHRMQHLIGQYALPRGFVDSWICSRGRRTWSAPVRFVDVDLELQVQQFRASRRLRREVRREALIQRSGQHRGGGDARLDVVPGIWTSLLFICRLLGWRCQKTRQN